VDCPRRWSAHVAALPAEATPHLAQLQAKDLHSCSNRGQLDSNEEGSKDIPVPSPNRGRCRSC